MAELKTDVCSVTTVDAEKVAAVQQKLPQESAVRALAETFKVLGDPTRVRIVMALMMDELCVCDLAALTGLSVSAISHQLRMLRNLKLVKYRRKGKMAYYSLDDEHIEQLIQVAMEHVHE